MRAAMRTKIAGVKRATGSQATVMAMALLSVAGGCTSAEEKCAQRRAEAEAAWTAYLQVLETQAAAEKKAIADAKLALEGSIDKRLSFKAKQEATRMHDEGTMEWHRTYTALYQAACTGDEECRAVRMKKTEAETTLEGLDKTLKTSRLVVEAIDGPAEGLSAAASGVEEDFDHAAYKPAMATVETVREACAGL